MSLPDQRNATFRLDRQPITLRVVCPSQGLQRRPITIRTIPCIRVRRRLALVPCHSRTILTVESNCHDQISNGLSLDMVNLPIRHRTIRTMAIVYHSHLVVRPIRSLVGTSQGQMALSAEATARHNIFITGFWYDLCLLSFSTSSVYIFYCVLQEHGVGGPLFLPGQERWGFTRLMMGKAWRYRRGT